MNNMNERLMKKAMARTGVLAGVLALLLCSVSIAAAQSAPGLTVSAPKEGDSVGGTSMTVNFSVTDFTIKPTTVPLSEAGKHPELNRAGEGHLHFQLDLQPLIVWDQSAPYTFTNIPPGDHQVMVELANNDHASLSPRVMQMIHFRTTIPLPATGATGAEAATGGQWLRVGMLLTLALLVLVSGILAGGRTSWRLHR